MNYKTEIEGHKFWFRSSGTGSWDPWSLDYAHENGINLLITGDCANFVLVDWEDVYKFHIFNRIKPLLNGDVKSYDEAIDLIVKCSDRKKESLSENIESLKKMKGKW